MATLARLLLFCDFLQQRVQTSSLSLLRRMLADFYAGNEHTLLDFMRLGAAVVAVTPVERKGTRRRQAAARLLTRQKQLQAENVPQDTSPSQVDARKRPQPEICVFRYLSARVATKNILWLRDMFDEFCRGQDALLREFVQCGSELITVVPVDIQALSLAPLPPPPLMVPGPVEMHATEETTRSEVAPPPTLSTQRKRPGESEQRYVNGEEEVDDDTIGDRTRKRARAVSDNADDEAEAEAAAISVERAIHTTLLLSDDHVRASIMETFKRVEEKEPWKQAFNPDNLSMPFSRAKHPELAAALKEFWEKHSQAVWERKFWAPLSRSRTHSLHTYRRGRQSKAQNAFERNVLLAVYKKFGAGFFVQLDKRDTPESGWYYLDQVVDLFTLGRRCGLPACLQYIELEASKRFPVAPGLGRGFYSRVNGKSRSMWSSAYALQPVVKEIVALKAKENGAP